MRRTTAALTTTLVAALLAAGCGTSSASHPTHAQLLQGFGDVLGSSGAMKNTANPTPRTLIAAMGQSWVLQVCQEKSDAALEGVSASKAQSYFDKGYTATAPTGAPAPTVIFSQIVAACTAQGL